MLPVHLRFPLRHHPLFFESAFKKRTAHLLAFVGSGAELLEEETQTSMARFAVIIKKTHGNAVQRVKFKRMVRSAVLALFHRRPELFAVPYSFVLMPLGRVQSVETYEEELIHLLESAVLSAR